MRSRVPVAAARARAIETRGRPSVLGDADGDGDAVVDAEVVDSGVGCGVAGGWTEAMSA
jgi:hypothetical protein